MNDDLYSVADNRLVLHFTHIAIQNMQFNYIEPEPPYQNYQLSRQDDN